MVKIKTIKKLNLPQLIEYAWENDVRDLSFRGHDKKGYVVSISINDKGEFTSDWRISKNDTFTIEVEEEITEDTELDLLLDHFINAYGQHYVGNIHHNRSINDILEENDELEIATNFIHILDKETKEFKLIWIDGKLVE